MADNDFDSEILDLVDGHSDPQRPDLKKKRSSQSSLGDNVGGDGTGTAKKRRIEEAGDDKQEGASHSASVGGDDEKPARDDEEEDDEDEDMDMDMDMDLESEDGYDPTGPSSKTSPAPVARPHKTTDSTSAPGPNASSTLHPSSALHSTSSSSLSQPQSHNAIPTSSSSSASASPTPPNSNARPESSGLKRKPSFTTATAMSATGVPLSGGVALGRKSASGGVNTSSGAATSTGTGASSSATITKPGTAKKRHPLPAKPVVAAGGRGKKQGSGSKPQQEEALMYPLEGKYKDEDDRDWLDGLPEIEREDIIATRLEEQQKQIDSRALRAMYAAKVGEEEPAFVRTSGEASSEDQDAEGAEEEEMDEEEEDMQIDNDEDEVGDKDVDVAGRARRKTTTQQEPKNKAMAALQERRKAKSEGRKKPSFDNGSSPEELDERDIFSDEGDEDDYRSSQRGRTTRGGRKDDYYTDSEEEDDRARDRDRRRTGTSGRATESRSITPITSADLNRVLLTRANLADFKHRNFFSKMVQGAYLKLSAGLDDRKRPKYRIYEIVELESKTVPTYKIENGDKEVPDNRTLLVQYGSARKSIKMAEASNQPIHEDEVRRWKSVMDNDRQALPTSAELARKATEMDNQRVQPFTSEELKAKLEFLKNLGIKSQSAVAFSRVRLEQERSLAYRRNDIVKMQEIEQQLREMDAVDGGPQVELTDANDVMAAKLARVNEKNRKAALEASKRAHRAEVERRKAADDGDLMDPSARVKMKLKSHDASIPKALRRDSDTQGLNTGSATVDLTITGQANGNEPAVVLTENGDIAVEVDLGDF